MSRPSLVLLLRRDPSGEVALCAPKVGVVTDPPAPGSLVGPGSPAGRLTQLARRFDLRIPPGVAGTVAEGHRKDRSYPVAYGEELFRVVATAVVADPARILAASSATAAGTHRVLAPTDGVFYRGSGPGSPPFAPVGGRLAAGQTLGLIEVMKTFNPILYGGGVLPDPAEVVEVLVGDGEEVRAGQPLLVVK